MIIRKLKESDIDNCLLIFNLVAPSENWNGYIDRLLIELKAMFQQGYIIPNYLVIEIDNKIVGFGGYSNTGFNDDIYGLCWCVVHPDFQGKGIGKKLTEVRIEEIKKIGGKIILSSTKKLWHLTRFGFEDLGICGDDYHLMKLHL